MEKMLYIVLITGAVGFMVYRYLRYKKQQAAFLDGVQIDVEGHLQKQEFNIEAGHNNYSGYIGFYVKNTGSEPIISLVFTTVTVKPEYMNVRSFPLYFEKIEIGETVHRSISFSIHKSLVDRTREVRVQVKGGYRDAGNRKYGFSFQRDLGEIIVAESNEK
ncbi:hypothetical protein EIM50_18545 [Pseudoxanthomonas sp. SGD-10]|nr:hypothetical protein EIM50_18545 [Pseudoxanthomonas sp. SGD-10]